MRPAAIAFAVAAVAAASAHAAAEAAGGPASMLRPQDVVQTAGFCVPAPEDGTAIPRAVGALGVGAPTTKPIAVLDTGVDPTTPELAGRVLPGVDARTGAAVGGDANGHGTQVAAIAAGSGPAFRGVSPTSPILPVRVYDDAGSATADALAKGIAIAVQKGAGTIVFSGAQKLSEVGAPDQLKVVRAIGDAFKKGILTVVAAGNDGDDLPSFPAALPHVIAVGGASAGGLRAAFSNKGPWVDVLAPGEGVTAPLAPPSCVYGYGFATGTSFAAPAVAGIAALVAQLRPQLDIQQRFELVRRAARDIGIEGRDNETGFGMADAAAAMTALPQAKENNPEVDDDPFWVRGAYAKAYPPYVTKRKKLRFKASGSVSPAKDPADVYPIEMAKGDRIVVTVSGTSAGALLELTILSPAAGDFDITNGVEKYRMASTGGLSPDPQLEARAKRSGIHYIAIEAADPVDPEDPSAQPAAIEPYRVSAFKQHKKARKQRTK